MTKVNAFIMDRLLEENNFYPEYTEVNDKFLVIGKKGRFVKNKYTSYEIRVSDNKITYESKITDCTTLKRTKESIQVWIKHISFSERC